MTARTLEEIECDVMRDRAYLDPCRANPELIRHAPRLLVIAQEQRAEIARLREKIRGWQDDHPFPG